MRGALQSGKKHSPHRLRCVCDNRYERCESMRNRIGLHVLFMIETERTQQIWFIRDNKRAEAIGLGDSAS